MKILIAASEMVPFAKTGGLADVAQALPQALAELGHEVAVVMPFYGCIDRKIHNIERVLPEVLVDLPLGRRAITVWKTMLNGAGASAIPVYLIEDQGLFNRPQLYAENGRDYPDNAFRFAYFCLASLWMLKGLDWIPDVIQCNDWQTALIPTYLSNLDYLSADEQLGSIKTLFTIHNLSYQGIFSFYNLEQLGLPATLFQPDGLEFYGNINLLKGGILYSDHISTVSRQYAKEIQTPEFGCGLEGLLTVRADRLTGILNGIDTSIWNPETDPLIPARFTAKKIKNKAACKKHLIQQRMGMPYKAGRPVLGMISRLADQKGFDLLVEILPELLQEDMQFVLLGTGQPEYHKIFKELATLHPEKVAVALEFNDELAHQIEAGSDMFLMPSQFEPCGLNQLYSLRYGTIPIVRKTGGLADSIINVSPAGIAAGKATGFVFTEYSGPALLDTIRKALRLYQEKPESWAKLVENAMTQDFSWHASAQEYEKLFKKLAPKKKEKPKVEPVAQASQASTKSPANQPVKKKKNEKS